MDSAAVENTPTVEAPDKTVLTSVYPELQAVPPSTAPTGSAAVDPLATYYAIALDDLQLIKSLAANAPPFINPGKTFFITGDTVYVQRLDGTGQWALQMGSNKNPMIRLYEGMTLKRKFAQLRVVLGDGRITETEIFGLQASELMTTRIELLVSTGDLVLDPPIVKYGFGPRMLGKTDCVASTTRRFFCADFDPTQGIFLGFESFAPGKMGATLILRNTDPANTLFLGSASIGEPPPSLLGANTLFRLLPGETITLTLDGQIVNWKEGWGLTVFTSVGTCKYDWWISRVSTDSPVGVGITTPY